MKHITKFFFDRAVYCVGDDRGNKILLIVNYTKNRYKLVELNTEGSSLAELKGYSAKVAKNLLLRKHNINFANKLYVNQS